jgi:hypothetical protein
MPEIDFNTVDDVEDYSPLPEGEYPCCLVDIDPERKTQYGDEMWRLKFKIAEGDFEGRNIFDNMVFSEQAMKRVKLICSRLGLNTSGKVNLTPDMLIGHTALVTVGVESYEATDDNGSSRTKKRNVVLFAGYERWDGGPTATSVAAREDTDEKELPF